MIKEINLPDVKSMSAQSEAVLDESALHTEAKQYLQNCGYEQFRAGQIDCIVPTARGLHCIGKLPTGNGWRENISEAAWIGSKMRQSRIHMEPGKKVFTIVITPLIELPLSQTTAVIF